ncbi:MAG: MCE family protein [Planctomycetes bacterium]|nr:MCE family protein [Planctomycetota bacterium]
MSAPANRWKLGLFVVGVTMLGIGGLTWLGVTTLERPTRTAWVYFDEAVNGLEEGSPVKFRGVSIGTVDDIGVAPDRKHIAVRAALLNHRLVELGFDPATLEPDCPLPPGLRAQLITAWVTQTSFVQVDFFPDDVDGPQSLPFPTPANTIRAVRSTMKSFDDGARALLAELPGLAASARTLLQELNQDLRTANLPDLAERASRLLTTAEERVQKVEELAVLRRATSVFTEAETLVRDFRAPDGQMQRLLGDLSQLAAQLRQSLANVDAGAMVTGVRDAAASVGGAADTFSALSADLRGQLQHLRSALAAIERLAALLERDPGSLLHGKTPAKSPLGGQEK